MIPVPILILVVMMEHFFLNLANEESHPLNQCSEDGCKATQIELRHQEAYQVSVSWNLFGLSLRDPRCYLISSCFQSQGALSNLGHKIKI